MKGTLTFDGGARPTNPGHAAFASILVLDNGREHVISRYIGWHTNNYAEYSGLLVGIKMAIDNNVSHLDIITDSQLIEGQLLMDWRCNVKELKIMRDEALKLLRLHYGEQLGWTITWKRRDKNVRADALCTEAIAFGRNQNPFTPSTIKDKRGVARVVDHLHASSRPIIP